MKIAGVEISHPDKIIFQKEKITKLQMVQYYEKVAEKMLPYLKNRPLTLHRFPDGIEKEGFYQKSASDYFPDYIKRIKVETEAGSNTQFICNTMKSLIYLANQGTVAFHIWLSKKDKMHKPDKVVFDLDPPENSFEKVKEAAQIIGEQLKKEGKDPNLMTSGKKGIHVWYSIRRTKDFDELREEVRKTAEELQEKYPELLTTSVRKNKRDGKIFIDYLRNAYAQTSVCPYSLRAIPTAGVATPIPWKELKSLKGGDAFTIFDYL